MSRRNQYTNVTGTSWTIGRELLPELVRIGSQVDGVVADIGCGESPFRAEFAVASRYLRLDFNPQASDVLPCELPRVPLMTGSVDCVLLSQVLGDVFRLADAFAEFARVLRPAGMVVIFETMSYPEHDLPHDFFRILPCGVQRLAADAGFRVVRLVRLGGAFSRLALFVNTFLLGRLENVSPLLRSVLQLVVNRACAALDACFRLERLAPDYLAVLVKE